MLMLNKCLDLYAIPVDLYLKIKNSFSNFSDDAVDEINEFLEDLPHKLKVETSVHIYDKTI